MLWCGSPRVSQGAMHHSVHADRRCMRSGCMRHTAGCVQRHCLAAMQGSVTSLNLDVVRTKQHSYPVALLSHDGCPWPCMDPPQDGFCTSMTPGSSPSGSNAHCGSTLLSPQTVLTRHVGRLVTLALHCSVEANNLLNCSCLLVHGSVLPT